MAIEGRIGVLGGGNMGSALVKGLLQGGTASAAQVVVAEKLATQAAKLREQLGVAVVDGPAGLGPVDLLLVAVKPKDVATALHACRDGLSPQALVISIAAGVKLQALAGHLPPGQPLVRAMPNTPALVMKGVSALCPAEHTPPEALDLARQVFAAVGQVVVVAEGLMDVVTGLSASGPAYVFLIIEALADAGVLMGLDRQSALTLAAGTVAGAAELMIQTGQHPALLKDMVTSPGGTTIAGLRVLENAGLRGALMEAVAAATKRSQELGG
ncbi:MAG: pyrroline-5-carboxylate reductase [Desulfarculus sp.]|nr:pyrroline-5-carboxylate reductase [Desulfarculus sp.]